MSGNRTYPGITLKTKNQTVSFDSVQLHVLLIHVNAVRLYIIYIIVYYTARIAVYTCTSIFYTASPAPAIAFQMFFICLTLL